MKEYINLVPTSAITGEGLPDFIGLLIYLAKRYLINKITFKDEVKCSILEVKLTEIIASCLALTSFQFFLQLFLTTIFFF